MASAGCGICSKAKLKSFLLLDCQEGGLNAMRSERGSVNPQQCKRLAVESV